MKQLKFEQFLPISLDKAWKFFSDPANLNRITPPEMKFRIVDKLPERIYPGLQIRYIIHPMLKVAMQWVTVITVVKDHEMFVDEQLKGPYAYWRHEHHFFEVDGGVMVIDKLTYHIGRSFIGWIAGKIWVDKQIIKIFEYRKKILGELFSA